MRLSDDLSDARWIHIKGWLFLVLSGLAVVGLLLPSFTVQNVAFVAIALWGACRWYYYMFYVIEKYVDSEFRFAGLGSVLKYLAKKPKS